MAHTPSLSGRKASKLLKPSTKLVTILTSEYAKLRCLLKKAEAANFAIAEQVRHLKDKLGQSFRVIGKQVGYSHVYIRDLYLGATFPVRHKGASLNAHILTAKSVKRVEKKISRETGKPYKMNAKRALAEIVKHNFPRARPATDHLVKIARDEVAPLELCKAINVAAKSGHILDRCFHGDWRKLVPQIQPKSVRLFLLDPPYGGYTKHPDGHLDVYGSVAADLIGLDSGTSAQATREVVDCFRLLGDAIHPDGILALWQRASWPSSEIVKASEDNGWHSLPPFIWDKSMPQPTDFESPTYSTEFCWLFRRDGGQPSNFNGSSRMQVLSREKFPPVQGIPQGEKHRHFMQKPESLSTFLIEKFTRPQDIVAELFGCSGSGCIAAIRAGRHFLYSESFKENYAFGCGRIAAELTRNQHEKKAKNISA